MADAAVIVGRVAEQPSPGLVWDRTPLRGELFSIERLEEHARSLAAAQPVAAGHRPGHQLADRLAVNAAFLLKANSAIADTDASGHHATPAAEWLADNYHLVDMQIREIGIDLPRGYYSQLPKLADRAVRRPASSLRRGHGRWWRTPTAALDPEALRRYLLAYQSVQPLTIGELWAVPITLRIVLIENLRRIAAMVVVYDAAERQKAERSGGPAAEPRSGATRAFERARHLAEGIQTVATDAFAVAARAPVARTGPETPIRRSPGSTAATRVAQGTTPASTWCVHDELQRQGTSNATVQQRHQQPAPDRERWTGLSSSMSVCADGRRALADRMRLRRHDDSRPRTRSIATAIEDLARGSAHGRVGRCPARAVGGRRVVSQAHARAIPGYHWLFSNGRASVSRWGLAIVPAVATPASG